MVNTILLLIAIVVGIAVCVAVGMLVGLRIARLETFTYGLYQEAAKRFKDQADRLEELSKEVEEPDEPQVITTTPRLIETKRRAGKLNDEDSAIVTVKTPRERMRDKEETMQQFIQRIS